MTKAKRKIVQVVADPAPDSPAMYFLCDDGTVWVRTLSYNGSCKIYQLELEEITA